jgi:hypothetical protein
MTDEPTAAPKKRRKPARKAKAKPRAAAPPAPISGEFAGLTARECCDKCRADARCLISAEGSGVCSHPNKGGVRGTDMNVAAVISRGARAAKLLKHQKIEIRSDQ